MTIDSSDIENDDELNIDEIIETLKEMADEDEEEEEVKEEEERKEERRGCNNEEELEKLMRLSSL